MHLPDSTAVQRSQKKKQQQLQQRYGLVRIIASLFFPLPYRRATGNWYFGSTAVVQLLISQQWHMTTAAAAVQLTESRSFALLSNGLFHGLVCRGFKRTFKQIYLFSRLSTVRRHLGTIPGFQALRFAHSRRIHPPQTSVDRQQNPAVVCVALTLGVNHATDP